MVKVGQKQKSANYGYILFRKKKLNFQKYFETVSYSLLILTLVQISTTLDHIWGS